MQLRFCPPACASSILCHHCFGPTQREQIGGAEIVVGRHAEIDREAARRDAGTGGEVGLIESAAQEHVVLDANLEPAPAVPTTLRVLPRLQGGKQSVSYTHLTLPTSDLV